MICYARFQCAAQLLIDILADELAGFPAIEKRPQLCQTALNAMYSAAPHSDLQYCQTAKGATWQNVVDCFFLYFETRDASELSLTGSSITFTALIGRHGSISYTGVDRASRQGRCL